jgi:hypothetical protein
MHIKSHRMYLTLFLVYFGRLPGSAYIRCPDRAITARPHPRSSREPSRMIEDFPAPPPYRRSTIAILSALVPCSRSVFAAGHCWGLSSSSCDITLSLSDGDAPNCLPPFLTNRLFWLWPYRVRPQLLDTFRQIGDGDRIASQGLSSHPRWRSCRCRWHPPSCPGPASRSSPSAGGASNKATDRESR